MELRVLYKMLTGIIKETWSRMILRHSALLTLHKASRAESRPTQQSCYHSRVLPSDSLEQDIVSLSLHKYSLDPSQTRCVDEQIQSLPVWRRRKKIKP